MTPTVKRPATRADLELLVRDGSIDTVIVAVCDPQGRLQGKRVDATFLLEEAVTVEGCSYVLASDVDMRTLDGFELASWARGYGDLTFRPDYGSLRVVPWHERTAVVLADVTTGDGTPVEVSPRQILARQVERLAERGFHALVGTELEFLVFEDTYAAAWSARYHGLTPVSRYNVDYSIQGSSVVEPLLGRIRRSMRDAGMVVESSKGECNLGQYEIAFKYDEPIAKCDEHSIFKLGAKEIAAQEGCSLTFMAKFDEREGSSCHVHLSLRDRDDSPVFPGPGAHGFSRTFEQFLAGLLASSAELTLLHAPNVNSYKRYAAGSFAPTALVWGPDNRTCAFRTVGHGPSLRVECRLPGGDVNPYLTVAALLAGGLAGIDDDLGLPEPCAGNAYVSDAARVPTTLRDAADLFESSDLAARTLGAEVVRHYVHAARSEEAAFREAVTDWERVRGFERL